ncbi:galactose-specific lectin nattectin-like [Odontesthes bonariensis]|uniref:galactose-specific lectin nattectin-like n=1 Tax=Odontesthes bonariensis TaxID=219752 RepID=UPI003F584918
MASGFNLVFFGFISSLLIVQCRYVQKEDDEPVPPGCPPGWTQFGSCCFIYYHTAKAWIDAEHVCMGIGGNLASIHSADENLFLSDLVKRVTGVHHLFWVGGFDAVAEGRWQWTDGSDFNYSNWLSGQPTNHGGKEHCIDINYGGGFWNDLPCHHGRSFICGKKL